MAMRTRVMIYDDLDYSEGGESVTFGLDGHTYEIDLASKNRAKLDKVLAPYLTAGRRVTADSRRPRPHAAGGSGFGAQGLRAVRTWAAEQGIAWSHHSQRH
jgi:hypothetical protein